MRYLAKHSTSPRRNAKCVSRAVSLTISALERYGPIKFVRITNGDLPFCAKSSATLGNSRKQSSYTCGCSLLKQRYVRSSRISNELNEFCSSSKYNPLDTSFFSLTLRWKYSFIASVTVLLFFIILSAASFFSLF